MGNSKIPKYWLSSLSENISLKYTLDSQRLILISVSLVHDEGYTLATFFFFGFLFICFPILVTSCETICNFFSPQNMIFQRNLGANSLFHSTWRVIDPQDTIEGKDEAREENSKCQNSASPYTAQKLPHSQNAQHHLRDGRFTLNKLNWEDLNSGPQEHLAWKRGCVSRLESGDSREICILNAKTLTPFL